MLKHVEDLKAEIKSDCRIDQAGQNEPAEYIWHNYFSRKYLKPFSVLFTERLETTTSRATRESIRTALFQFLRLRNNVLKTTEEVPVEAKEKEKEGRRKEGEEKRGRRNSELKAVKGEVSQ